MCCQIEQLQLKCHKRHILWPSYLSSPHHHHPPPPPPMHGCHHCHQAPWLMPTLGPHQGKLINSTSAQQPHQPRHIIAPQSCQQCPQPMPCHLPLMLPAKPPTMSCHCPSTLPWTPLTCATTLPPNDTNNALVLPCHCLLPDQMTTTVCAMSLLKVWAGDNEKSGDGGPGRDVRGGGRRAGRWRRLVCCHRFPQFLSKTREQRGRG